jgi:hypothetical protein
MDNRRLTKEQRDQLRVVCMLFVAHDSGNDAVTSANTTIDLCCDLDSGDAEIIRLRNALSELDTWLHFDTEWGDNEAIVPLPHQVEAWRKSLAIARDALKG